MTGIADLEWRALPTIAHSSVEDFFHHQFASIFRAPVAQKKCWLFSRQELYIYINIQLLTKAGRKPLTEIVNMKRAVPKPFVSIGIRKRTTFVDVLYGEKVGDPKPFILTVSSRYVSRKIYKALPLNIAQIEDYAVKHADTALREIAISRRDAGCTTHAL